MGLLLGDEPAGDARDAARVEARRREGGCGAAGAGSDARQRPHAGRPSKRSPRPSWGRARRPVLGGEAHRSGRAPSPRVRPHPKRRSQCGCCASPETARWRSRPPRSWYRVYSRPQSQSPAASSSVASSRGGMLRRADPWGGYLVFETLDLLVHLGERRARPAHACVLRADKAGVGRDRVAHALD